MLPTLAEKWRKVVTLGPSSYRFLAGSACFGQARLHEPNVVKFWDAVVQVPGSLADLIEERGRGRDDHRENPYKTAKPCVSRLGSRQLIVP
jgi:hypothetical protein